MALDPDTFDALIGTIRRFVAERLRPLEERVAEEDEVPGDVVREMREMGLFGLSIPEEFGGLGLTMSEEVRVALVFGRTTPTFRSVFGTNVGIGSQGLVMAGSDEQKEPLGGRSTWEAEVYGWLAAESTSVRRKSTGRVLRPAAVRRLR